MDFTLILLIAGCALVAVNVLRRQSQRKRIELLSHHLTPYQIEHLLAQLLQGYPRAAGEATPERSRQVFAILDASEQRLVQQVGQFAQGFAQQVPEQDALMSTGLWQPGSNVDVRKLFRLHAQGIEAAATPVGGDISPREDATDATSASSSSETLQQRKQRAYTMSAELLLFQHTCHWFCRTRQLANVRLLVAHQTPLEQVLANVSPTTRRAYGQLMSG